LLLDADACEFEGGTEVLACGEDGELAPFEGVVTIAGRCERERRREPKRMKRSAVNVGEWFCMLSGVRSGLKEGESGGGKVRERRLVAVELERRLSQLCLLESIVCGVQEC
jgi:hypothetical protein